MQTYAFFIGQGFHSESVDSPLVTFDAKEESQSQGKEVEQCREQLAQDENGSASDHIVPRSIQ